MYIKNKYVYIKKKYVTSSLRENGSLNTYTLK